MQGHFRKSVWLAVASLVILSLIIGSVLAHEGRPVGGYRFVVGWLEEPAYEGAQNAVSVRVNKVVEGTTGEGSGNHGESSESGPSDEGDKPSGHGEGSGGHSSLTPSAPKVLASIAGQHEGETVPVEGLEGSLQVEVAHVPSGASRVQELLAVFGEPGHYVATLIPTAAGIYEFRVFGTIEGMAVDETFVSRGGGGGFDDIRSSADLQFPEQLPEIREIESGLRGALQTAQQAQDTALAAQDSGGNALAIVALIVGIVGVVFGIGGIYFGLRARQT